MQRFEVDLPFPPTANTLFPTGRNNRRFKSPKYKAWIKSAETAFYQQFPHWLVDPVPTILGEVHVVMHFGRPDKRRRDLANLEKATTDFIVNMGVIEDDCLIQSLFMMWSPIEGCHVAIRGIHEHG